MFVCVILGLLVHVSYCYVRFSLFITKLGDQLDLFCDEFEVDYDSVNTGDMCPSDCNFDVGYC